MVAERISWINHLCAKVRRSYQFSNDWPQALNLIAYFKTPTNLEERCDGLSSFPGWLLSALFLPH